MYRKFFLVWPRWEICLILASRPYFKKTTLLSSTSELKEKPLVLLFFIYSSGAVIWWFWYLEHKTLGWTIIPDLTRTRNCSYLGSDAVVDKYKFTLLSQTLKVEVNKVVLLYSSIAQEPRYGHFVIWTISCWPRWGVCHISYLRLQLKNVRPLFLFHLSKLEKMGWPYYQIWPMSQYKKFLSS